METFYTIVQDCLLYGIFTIALSISSKEFGLYNLAGGAWLITGGWLGTYIFGYFSGISVPLNAWIIPVVLFLFLLQVLTPFFFRTKLTSNKLAYLFVSLGIALFLSNFMTSVVLDSHSSIIPLDQSKYTTLFAISISFLIIILTTLLISANSWAQTVIKFRLKSMELFVIRNMSFLIAIEIFLIILLGASTFYIHKGIYGNAEYRTLIPLLAIFFAKSQPWKAAIWSFSIILTSHLLIILLPYFHFYSISEYASTIVIFVFVGIVLIKYSYKSRLFLTRTSEHISTGGNFKKLNSNFRSDLLIGSIIIVLVLTLSTLIYLKFINIYANVFLTAIFSISFSLIAWFLIRFLGIMTVTIPVIALSFVFLTQYLSDNIILLSIGFISLTAIWSYYFFINRILPSEPAFIVDLALLVGLHEFIKRTPLFSGAEDLIMFNLSSEIMENLIYNTIFQILLVLPILSFPIIIMYNRVIRGNTLGIVNFKAGLLNGIEVKKIFLYFSAIMICIIAFSGISSHIHNQPISVHESSLENGILIFLFGYLANRVNILISILIILLFYLLIPTYLSGSGLILNIISGVLIYSTAYVLKSGGNNV